MPKMIERRLIRLDEKRAKLRRLERLLNTELQWTQAGGGDMGRNSGQKRRAKKARAHAARLQRLQDSIKQLNKELSRDLRPL